MPLARAIEPTPKIPLLPRAYSADSLFSLFAPYIPDSENSAFVLLVPSSGGELGSILARMYSRLGKFGLLSFFSWFALASFRLSRAYSRL